MLHMQALNDMHRLLMEHNISVLASATYKSDSVEQIKQIKVSIIHVHVYYLYKTRKD